VQLVRRRRTGDMSQIPTDRRDQLKFIAIALAEVGHGQRRALIEQEAAKLAISPATLYRQLETVGWASGRKARADKGTTRVPEENLQFVAAARKAAIRQNGKATLPTCVAASIAVQNGIDLPVCNATLNRLMRARHMDTASQKQATPAVGMRSLHPNHVHEVDPSLCLVYYDRGQQIVIRDDELYKNKLSKLAELKLKVWRYVLTDHTSGTIIPWYVSAKGESQKNLFEFLMFAWSKRDGRPFHGVPRMLMMDPGSANTAASIRNLLEALQVELIVNKPRNARAKGSVENAQNIVETHFESRLRFRPASSVEEMNAAAFAWANAYNANLIPRVDSRLRRDGVNAQTRYDVWLQIRMEELRLLPAPELCLNLLLGAKVERKVSNKLTVTYKHPQLERSGVYDLSGLAGVCAGDAVEVCPMVYGRGLVTVRVPRYDGETLSYRLEPITEYDANGFRLDAPVIGESYRPHADTAAVIAAKQLDRTAFGDLPADAIQRAKDKNARPFAHLNDGRGIDSLEHLKAIQAPTWLPRKGEAIDVKLPKTEAPAEIQLRRDLHAEGHALNVPTRMQVDSPPLGHVDAAMRLRTQLGDAWTAEMFALLAALYPQGVPEEELAVAAERLQGREVEAPRGHLRAVK
jgi:hypothetical protein